MMKTTTSTDMLTTIFASLPYQPHLVRWAIVRLWLSMMASNEERSCVSLKRALNHRNDIPLGNILKAFEGSEPALGVGSEFNIVKRNCATFILNTADLLGTGVDYICIAYAAKKLEASGNIAKPLCASLNLEDVINNGNIKTIKDNSPTDSHFLKFLLEMILPITSVVLLPRRKRIITRKKKPWNGSTGKHARMPRCTRKNGILNQTSSRWLLSLLPTTKTSSSSR
jgi:hypothetical protein